jgi:enoyl-CoA hydratase
MTGVDVTFADGVLSVALDRPERRNALDAAMLDALEQAAAQASSDETVRAVVLSGRGPAFCAGADLAPTVDTDGVPGPTEAMLTTSDRVFRAWEAIPVPVVAAVDGAAFAGGLELLLCCDLIVAGPRARFADAHSRFGLLPGAGGAYRLPRRVGAAAAKLLLFTGDDIDVAEAHRLGLVDVIAPDGDTNAAVGELVATLVSRSPRALRELKRLVRTSEVLPVDAGLAEGLDAIIRHRRTADYAEGLRAFAERREPRFTGR